MVSQYTKPISTSYDDKSVLGLAIVLALLAHAILLAYIKLPPNPKIFLPATLEVKFAPLPEKIIKEIPIEQPATSRLPANKIEHLTPVQVNKKISKIYTQSQQSVAILDTKTVSSHPTENDSNDSPLATEPPKKQINYGSLMESAKQIAKEDARSITHQKGDEVLLSDRPFSPELANLLEKKVKIAGVTKYADGMIKIVTPSGTEYCIQSSPIMLKDNFDNAPIAMTCP